MYHISRLYLPLDIFLIAFNFHQKSLVSSNICMFLVSSIILNHLQPTSFKFASMFRLSYFLSLLFHLLYLFINLRKIHYANSPFACVLFILFSLTLVQSRKYLLHHHGLDQTHTSCAKSIELVKKISSSNTLTFLVSSMSLMSWRSLQNQLCYQHRCKHQYHHFSASIKTVSFVIFFSLLLTSLII